MGAPTRIGRYELLERVGRGSMGALYRGRDSILGRDVAVKVMAPGLLGNASAHGRFFRDAKAAARLQHANIVTIFEFGEHEQTPYLVMEFLRGESLAERLRKGPPLSLSQKLDIAIQICAGLEAAHAQDVVHRDIKPRNVWICENGTVKLLDFGIATAAATSGTFDILASPSYMSPEQIASKDVDRRTDIYSAGVVFYELFSGRRPFESDTPAGVLLKIVNESAPPIVSIDVPPALAAAIARAMERSPEARYSRAAELARELKTIKSQLTAPADATLLLDRTTLHVPAPTPQPPPVAAAPPAAAMITGPPGFPVTLLALVVGAILVGVTVFAVLWYTWPAGPASTSTSAPAPSPAATEPAAQPSEAPPAATPEPLSVTAMVRVDSQPPAAKILIDGTDTGLTTPADLPIDTSRLPARVQLELPGYRTGEASVTSEVVQSGTVSVSLSPREPATRGRLIGSGEYAYELLDRQRVISAASERHDVVVSGLRSLRLRSDRYFLDQNIRVNLGDGGIVQVSAPPLGTVTITAEGALTDCRVFINDRMVDGGSLPVSNRAIASGVHRVRLTCSNGDALVRSVTVLPRQGSAVRFTPDAPVTPR
jgi:serine/threonine-protein kinase